MRNPVLEELRVRRLADIQEEMSCRAVWRYMSQSYKDGRRKKVEYHLHKGGGLEKVRRWGDGVVYITKSRGSRKYKLQNKRI